MTEAASALMAALQFTGSDLAANQQGRLSLAQAARIQQARRRQLLLAALLFFSFVLGATILLFAGQRAGNAILTVAGGALIVMNALLVGLVGRGSMRVGSDLRANSVEALAGEVERVLRRGPQGDRYLLRINGDDLRVTRDVFQGFRHERLYRIYRTKGSRLLLSAEAIG
ncbi:MAG: hypothetical protein OXE95_08615 [Chloroflexi bacterium]|nr:hypothetical protein [Chloroflexota bacterium]MCY4247621.1 hypothetical protein [Chloroflexota bacterium]